MRAKITIVGAGNVGAMTAYCLAERGLGDIVLLDIPAARDVARGKALDILQAGPARGYDTAAVGTSSFHDARNSDIVVVTAGMARKPGMTREDLVQTNQQIVSEVVKKALRVSPRAIYIIVTNPLDTMLYQAKKVSGLPRQRIFGMAGVLDSARFCAFIAQELGVSSENVHATVLGGHGDEMVPLTRFCTVAGVPLHELLSAERIASIVERTRMGGGEIVDLLKTSAYYAPGASIAKMIEAILYDQKLIAPVSVCLEGEYGLSDICFGVPVVLGANGVERVIEYKLNAGERRMVMKSVTLIRKSIQALIP
ncbi:MAG: malate dehydrogenase [Burkholderiales bacterium]